MLDRAQTAGLRAERAPGLPVAQLLIGKRPDEAAELLPRLFNLCRAAQGAAARLALGLPLVDDTLQQLTREVLRDHLMKFHVSWPGQFGRPPTPLPADWARGGGAVARAVFGPAGALPATPADFDAYLASGQGIAPVLARIDGVFAPFEADAGALEPVTPQTAFQTVPAENSVAARHAGHPVLRHIADTRGRGPLWRAVGRAYDLQACLSGSLPALTSPGPGRALVPAARGTYAVTARVEDGKVTAFARVTPTDHLLVPGGVLDRTLGALPVSKLGTAPLLLDILDPCSPVRLKELAHA